MTILALGLSLGGLATAQTKPTSRQNPSAATTAPVVDLNGPEPGINFSTIFTEDEGPVRIVSENMTISDEDSTELTSAFIQLTNVFNGELERLSVDTSGTNIRASYNWETGVLQLTPVDTLENYQAVLRTLSYDNLSDAPNITDRVVTVVVSDGEQTSAEARSTIGIIAVNDAPVLDNSVEMRFTSINEDDRDNLGNTVRSIIDSGKQNGRSPITDPDENALDGIAVIEVGASNGVWQYRLASETTWRDFGAVSNTAAVLLNPAARIRFRPNLNFHGQTSIIFRAWDQTSGANGETGVDVSTNGGATAFSIATATARLDVLPVNDPPVIDLNGAAAGVNFTTNFVSGLGPVPVTAADATITDVDNTNLQSLTVKLLNFPDGDAEILTAVSPTTAITITPYDPTTGLLQFNGRAPLVDYQSALRAISYNNAQELPTTDDRIIQFTASDGADTSAIATTTVQIKRSNHAPSIDPAAVMQLSDIDEDTAEPAGDSVEAIINSLDPIPISDIDEEALLGFAVVGVDDSHGVWQYAVDGGIEWQLFSPVSNTAAVLLNAASLIRFVPAPDYFGPAGFITVRAWDQSGPHANGSRDVDTSTNGGATPFSSATAVATLNVLPVNDPPEIRLPDGIVADFVEGGNPVAVAGPSLSLFDIDNSTLVSATVTVDKPSAGELDFLSANTGNSGVSADYTLATGVLRLRGEALLTTYQAILRTITFENRSRNPHPADRIIRFVVNDGADDSNVVTTTVRVLPVNDPPVVDLNGFGAPGIDAEAYYDVGAGAILLSPNLDLEDVDNSELASASVRLLNQPNGRNELLDVNTAVAPALSAEYDQESGLLSLSGRATIADYTQVLRTLRYNNLLANPQRAPRILEVQVSDGSDLSQPARLTIRFRPQLRYLPLIQNDYFRQPAEDEPNNVCSQAFPLQVNHAYAFLAEDRHDWYFFNLSQPQTVRVEMTNFIPEAGQIVVASGSCDLLRRVGNNGDFATVKIVALGRLPAGRYYIWVINDGRFDTGARYNLTVHAN
jgi:hypothetical protein